MRRTLIALVVCAAALVAPASLASARTTKPAPAPTIVDVALAANAQTGEFDTLITAVVAADLVDTLSARGQRTVFAPTDAAFAAIGLDETNVGNLPKDVLTNILLFHVTAGRKYAAAVASTPSLKMLNGDRATVSLSPVAIDGAPIVATDIEASNGVIHVIGGVMLP